MKILYVDDDDGTRDLVRIILQKEGITLLEAGDGPQALAVWRRIPVDLILLDVMLPGMDGVQVLRDIRQESDVPVILLTARSHEQEILEGFEAGADDYIVKPFFPRELAARIRAVMNRARSPQPRARSQFVFDRLILDLETWRVTSGDKCVPVTPLEFRLLYFLMQQHGRTVTKQDILQNVWGYTQAGANMNIIEAAIKRLRRKIETDPSRPDFIHTVRGVGYRFGG